MVILPTPTHDECSRPTAACPYESSADLVWDISGQEPISLNTKCFDRMRLPAVQEGKHRQFLDYERSKLACVAASGLDYRFRPDASAQIVLDNF